MKTITIDRVKTHACPRCHGDLLLEVEDDDVAYYCLQCGRRADAAVIVRAQTATKAATLPNVQARAA
jgi:predicted RNA-binding Zn-ribbon protein involved in translation (DUF1610 family)